VWGDHAKPPVIPIRSRPIIAANGIAQTIEQGAQEKPLRRSHIENQFVSRNAFRR